MYHSILYTVSVMCYSIICTVLIRRTRRARRPNRFLGRSGWCRRRARSELCGTPGSEVSVRPSSLPKETLSENLWKPPPNSKRFGLTEEARAKQHRPQHSVGRRICKASFRSPAPPKSKPQTPSPRPPQIPNREGNGDVRGDRRSGRP